MSDHKPSFWTTLPGLLTGVASFLTAIVAFMTFLGVKSKAGQPSSETVEPTANIGKLQNLDHCREFAGDWAWFLGGVTHVEKDGHVDWRKNASDPQPVIIGRWTCADSKPKKYNINWQNGVTDTLVMSPDKKSLTGKNSLGISISGSRSR